MGGHISESLGKVMGTGNYHTLAYHHRAHGYLTLGGSLTGLLKGRFHELDILLLLCHRRISCSLNRVG